ncbi:MAG: 3-phosphoglycerate dehydrogenase [Chloroflexi bacterium]|nr:3-phosphoglycerate dehydrogenase [Chloroflexota bacterium]
MNDTVRVFYNSLGTPDMYALVRQELPPGFELVTLDSDSDIERCARIAGCRIAIVAAKPLSSRVLAEATDLELVHHQGVGWHDTTPADDLAERGIRLALTPEGTTTGVAEHTVLLALAAARRAAFADAELRQGRWHVNALRPVSIELAGKTVGYWGFGRIGQAAALRLRAFETDGIYVDPHASLGPEAERALGVRRVEKRELLQSADILSLHMPLTPSTTHILDRDALALMKPSAIVVNTARGGLIDDVALAEALAEGRLLAAGLDVFEEEPLSADSPLVTLPNVVLTPHISAGTRDAMTHKMRALFANLQRYVETSALNNEVDLATVTA